MNENIENNNTNIEEEESNNVKTNIFRQMAIFLDTPVEEVERNGYKVRSKDKCEVVSSYFFDKMIPKDYIKTYPINQRGLSDGVTFFSLGDFIKYFAKTNRTYLLETMDAYYPLICVKGGKTTTDKAMKSKIVACWIK